MRGAKTKNNLKEATTARNKRYIPSGYTLLIPLYSRNTYLVDGEGGVHHVWKDEYSPSNSAYLLDNGNLLRTCSPGFYVNKKIQSTAAGFYVREIARDGKVVWEFKYSDNKNRLHHDVKPLPNGNILMIAYERKTAEEAIAAGRDPKSLKKGHLLSESVIEVKPKGRRGGEIVWRWNLWDHLIQDFDSSKANYGDIASHPELLDINFAPYDKPDWVHLNSIDYNEELDQILLSSRLLSEVWIIDHSTSGKEASLHKGGKSGMGGDILYRWGNPQAYKRGGKRDRKLFGQHDPQWIGKGLPGEGNILIFNNGDGRPGKEYSSIEEIVPAKIKNGKYIISGKKSYGPDKPIWSYSGKKENLFSRHISGLQRLPNGNTLACNGSEGYIFEINSKKKRVWSYQNYFYEKNVFKKRIAETMKLTVYKPEQLNRKKEAVFNVRRYFFD